MESNNILIIHGYNVNNKECFYPWLKTSLEKLGHSVELPSLPNTTNPNINKQVNYIIKKHPEKKNIIIAHSLGSVVSLKLIEKLDYEVDSLILISGFADTNFNEGDEDTTTLANACDWKFNFKEIKSKVKNIYVLKPQNDSEVTLNQTKMLSENLNVSYITFKEVEDHACGEVEPEILNFIYNTL